MESLLRISDFSQTANSIPLSLLALFENHFSIDWVVELTKKKVSETLAFLEEKVKEEVLNKDGPGVYSFKDEKQKRFWLEQISPAEKEQIHRQIVLILLRELPDDPPKARVLAHHLLQISNDVDTARWLLRAGDAHLKVFRNEEALQCYRKILDDFSDGQGEEIDAVFVETAVKYSKISIGTDHTEKILEFLYDALMRAKRREKRTCESLLEMHIAKNKWLLSEYRSAFKHFEHGWDLAKTLNDSKLLRSAKTFSSFFLYWQGRFHEVVESYEKSVPDVERYPKGNYPLIASSLVGYCYCLVGNVTQGLGMLNSIHKYCLDGDNMHVAARASLNIGKVMLDIGQPDRALQYIETAIEEATRGTNDLVLISARLLSAYAHYLEGNHDQAIASLNQFVHLSERVKITVQPYPFLLALLWLMEEGRLPKPPGLSFDAVLRRMIRSENIFMKGVAYRFKALEQKKEGRPPETILRSLNTSIKWLEESGHQVQLAFSLIELVRQHLLLDNAKAAEKTAKRAYEILASFNSDLFPRDLSTLVRRQHHDEGFFKEILLLGKEIVTTRNIKELVQQIISTVNRITGAERGAIFLLEDNGKGRNFQLRASKNLTLDQISDPLFEPSMKMIKEVARTGRGRIVEMSPETAFPPPNGIIRSKICVPMILKDKVIGVLYHDNCFLSSAFKESDLELLTYIASLAGFALDNARAWEEVRRLNQKLQEEKLYYEEEHLESLHFDDIIGESPAIKRVLSQVNQVASTDATVLILGETGVGKELVARAIHRISPRSNGPFIRVNCSALPESLLPSELFGHEKGAFTGASSTRIGRFELADAGTLFLDEVGDLPLEVQVRLLQVLQHKEFERVGGSKTIHSDFRLLTATNHDLKQQIEKGRFRPDLYYRLNVFPIYVPPLRERKEDIPLLVYYFLRIYNSRMRKSVEIIPDEEMTKLREYHWPGNVRELENIIERGIILTAGKRFKVPELAAASPPSAEPGIKDTLSENEKHHILRALHKTGWKVRGPDGAAELLDIHPSTLTFRMKRLGISRPKGIPKRRIG